MTIEVKISQKQSIEILAKNTLTQEIGVKQDIVIVPIYKDVPQYEGDYEVTPKVSEQTLPTAKKLMSEDLTIKEIPYFEVGNNSGGDTVYIAKEI